MPEKIILEYSFAFKVDPPSPGEVEQYLLNHGWVHDENETETPYHTISPVPGKPGYVSLQSMTCRVWRRHNIKGEIKKLLVPLSVELAFYDDAIDHVLRDLAKFEGVTVFSAYHRITGNCSPLLKFLDRIQRIVSSSLCELQNNAQEK